MQAIELEEKVADDHISHVSHVSKRHNTNSSNDQKPKKRRSTLFDRALMSISIEQRRYRVNLVKRNYENNFYLNNIDQSIAFVIPYKYTCSVWTYLLFGIPFIISKCSNKKFCEIRGTPCAVPEAEFYLIIDEYGNYHICDLVKKHFDSKPTSSNITTTYTNIEFTEANEEFHVITYEYNHYFCYKKAYKEKEKKQINTSNSNIITNNNDNSSNNSTINNKTNNLGEVVNNDKVNERYTFESPVFSFKKAQNSTIYKTFLKHYLDGTEKEFQRSIYGQNKLTLKTLNFFTILISQFKNFFFIYPIAAIALWIYEQYLYYIVILVAFLIILFFTSYQKYLNKKSIIDFSLKKEKTITRVKDKGTEEEISYEELVPGEIIKIRENDILPCDCLLLEGFCSVIESTLTGESSSVMKYRLQNNDKLFNYNENAKSFLFSGTKIEKSSPLEFQCLVVGTGFNTQRGNLIQSVLFPKKSNFNFYRENLTFFIFITIVALIAIGVFSYLHIDYNKNENHKTKKTWDSLLIKILDVIFIVLPPTLPISLTVGTFYYQYSLNQRKIRCSDEYRLIAAGRVNKIILDKTGTLTKEDLELYGYRTTIKKRGEIIFDSLECDSKLYLSFLSEYYKKEFHRKNIGENQMIEDNEDDEIDNTMTYFLECLATCHSIAKIDGEHKGNCIDMKIFDNIQWQYEDVKSSDNSTKVNNDQYEMKPKKYYQITEEQYFNKENKDAINSSLNSYALKVIVRCPFDSRHQSMSVIVKNKFNNSIHFFIKGAPEKISLLCRPETLPSTFHAMHKKYTLRGFRVLACATKKMNGTEEEILNEEKKYNLISESNLTFLGFIIFQNRLKKKTKQVLTKLTEEGLFPIISTGDNAFTSISVVKECNLIDYNSKFCIMDINTNNIKNATDTQSMINQKERTSEYKETKKSINKLINGQNNIILKCSFEEIIEEKTGMKGIYEDLEVKLNRNQVGSLTSSSHNNENFGKSKVKYLSVSELNEKILNHPNMKLCIHSRVFDLIFFRDRSGNEISDSDESLDKMMNNQKEEQEDITRLREIIVEKAVLFFRMSPSDKSKLVQLYKKQDSSNIVSMCGDGANDCSALISADVGISLKSSENSVMTSHLMANTKSISVVNDIITIGRTCFENSSILLKILLLYAEITTLMRVLLEYKEDDMTNSQYIFVDCITVFCGCCLISISDPNFKATGRQFTRNILVKQFLFSVLGHSLFQVGLMCVYFFLIIEQSEYYISEETNESLDENNFTYYNSYIFILGSFQCLSFIFTFNYFSIQKESTFKNRILTIYLIIVALILLELISVGVFDVGCFKWKLAVFVPLGKGNNFSQKSRIILFGFCVLGFFLCMLWEYIIYYCLVDRTAVVGGMIKVNDNNSDKASEGLLEKEMDLNNMKDNLSED